MRKSGLKMRVLPYNLGGILDVGAQNQAPGRGNASLIEDARPQHIAIEGFKPLSLQSPHRVQVEVDHRDIGAPLG